MSDLTYHNIMYIITEYLFIIDPFLACNESVLDQDQGSQRRKVLGSSIGPMRARNKNFGPHRQARTAAHVISLSIRVLEHSGIRPGSNFN